jgi:hypothetical protein
MERAFVDYLIAAFREDEPLSDRPSIDEHVKRGICETKH